MIWMTCLLFGVLVVFRFVLRSLGVDTSWLYPTNIALVFYTIVQAFTCLMAAVLSLENLFGAKAPKVTLKRIATHILLVVVRTFYIIVSVLVSSGDVPTAIALYVACTAGTLVVFSPTSSASINEDWPAAVFMTFLTM